MPRLRSKHDQRVPHPPRQSDRPHRAHRRRRRRHGLSIEREARSPTASPSARTTCSSLARGQLLEYFAGARTDFDVPVRLSGTPFQQAVWAELERLGWGEATSYGALAAAVGAGSARAIGGAVGANPVPIIVGCHCVLASDGRITGYSGGDGVPTKLWLLGHERIGFAA